jgi:hypothetical protein
VHIPQSSDDLLRTTREVFRLDLSGLEADSFDTRRFLTGECCCMLFSSCGNVFDEMGGLVSEASLRKMSGYMTYPSSQ